MAEQIAKGESVVMTFEVTFPRGEETVTETVKKMEAAWAKSQELPTPVSVTFAGFSRA